jgi:hypothetical protein
MKAIKKTTKKLNPLNMFKLKMPLSKLFLYALIPGGPYYARIKELNGSVDKPWLFFPAFMFLPLSLIPVGMMAFGKIKDGKGGAPYDHLMWIPIITRFIVSIICKMFIDNQFIASIVILVISIISVIIPNFIRRYRECQSVKDKNKELSFQFDTKQIYKSFVDSIFEFSIAEFCIILIQYIPYIGIFFKTLAGLPIIGKIVGDIIWALCFINFYIMVNMFNQANMGDLCYPTKYNYPLDTTKLTIGFICLIVSIAYKMVKG